MVILLNQAVWASKRKGTRMGNDFVVRNIYGKALASKLVGYRSWQHISQGSKLAKDM